MRTLQLSVDSMRCRHCVRQVTSWLRDVPGVETVTADARRGRVVLFGTMTDADALAVFTGTTYDVVVLGDGEMAT